MCEPNHSVIQCEDPNDGDDDGLTAQGGYSTGRLTSGLTKWTKKIKKWLHLSMMGSGHSETIGARNLVPMHHYHRVFSLYEGHWWDRTFCRDGGLYGSSEQFECARDYSHQVCMGDLTQLRRFLETSFSNTDRLWMYVLRFRENFLNADGRKAFDKKFKSAFRCPFSDRALYQVDKQRFAKFALGFTRKRHLLVPEWADDDRIWTPNSGKLVSS